jgi:drug/metabolite transporter (DMT)-like permease
VTAKEAGFLQARVLFPFLLITLIWGSTWIVITDQLGQVPPAWSVAYRFAIGAAAMFVYARSTGASLRIGREGHGLALLFGFPQFCLNYNLVYAAEQHVTSGLVAVVFALLIVPNSLFAWLFLKQKATRGFLLGSAVALAGVALLFLQEYRAGGGQSGDVAAGTALALAATLAASISNVMQASERLRRRPVAAMLAWGMFYGALADVALAWLLFGAPTIETRLGYWVSLLYLAVAASALAFACYYQVIRAIGPARAAYSSVLIPILAMGLSTLFESYHWSAAAVAGGVLTLIGLVLALRARRPAVPAPDG